MPKMAETVFTASPEWQLVSWECFSWRPTVLALEHALVMSWMNEKCLKKKAPSNLEQLFHPGRCCPVCQITLFCALSQRHAALFGGSSWWRSLLVGGDALGRLPALSATLLTWSLLNGTLLSNSFFSLVLQSARSAELKDASYFLSRLNQTQLRKSASSWTGTKRHPALAATRLTWLLSPR